MIALGRIVQQWIDKFSSSHAARVSRRFRVRRQRSRNPTDRLLDMKLYKVSHLNLNYKSITIEWPWMNAFSYRWSCLLWIVLKGKALSMLPLAYLITAALRSSCILQFHRVRSLSLTSHSQMSRHLSIKTLSWLQTCAIWFPKLIKCLLNAFQKCTKWEVVKAFASAW